MSKTKPQQTVKGLKDPGTTQFDMAGTLESYGVDGRKRRETIPKEEILKEEVLQNVEDDKGCCVLKLFATSEHIVDHIHDINMQ